MKQFERTLNFHCDVKRRAPLDENLFWWISFEIWCEQTVEPQKITSTCTAIPCSFHVNAQQTIYGKYLHVNIEQSLDSRKWWILPFFINFFCCLYTVLCTYNLPQNAILYFLLHFGGPILAVLACLALKIPFRAAYQSNHSKAGARGDF